nr:ATP-dependent DNA helicase PcrA [Oscillospiraceae bacterium]
MQETVQKYLKAKRALFDKAFGARLNPEQCRAVFTADGPLLVLAGAGSGKTTVLVNRISYLIKYGNAYFADEYPEGLTPEAAEILEGALEMEPSEIEEILPQFTSNPASPWSVLAITFTNKAAREIKDRLLRTFGDEQIANSVWSGTFHSVCLRILRRYADRLGYREGFSIYDTDDKRRMISLCMKELCIDEKRLAPKAVASAISIAKDELKTPDDMEITRDPRSKDIIAIYKLYQKKLIEYNAVDFDDIIMKTVELLEGDAEIREYYQNKFKYVLVDEYQDTNYAQFVLTKLLSDKYRNIMVVGDDDQSIYKFRGATIENILNFDKTYPDATIIKLEQNYRSTGNILDAANAVIHHNGDRHEKRLWCDKGAGEKIILHESEDQNDEGRYIIDRVNSGIKRDGRKYSDYAVLYRINALGRSLQTSFAKSGVPYRVVGDMGFYDRKEVKDMMAYLSVLVSPFDNLRLKRIINEPKRKIGQTTVDAIEQIASANGLSMYEVVKNASEHTALAKNAEKLNSFSSIIEKVREEKSLPSEMISALFESSGYKDMLTAEGFEGEGKIQNVEEFIGAAVEYETRCNESGIEPTAPGFLEEISLVADVDKYDETADAVVLMTVHAAKGLEFPVVFLAGMEDGIFPSIQNIGEQEEMSEERRLAYVAITRAKEMLYITHAKNRMMYGKTTYNQLSRFIKEEMPKSLIFEDSPRPKQRQSYGAYQQTKPVERQNNYFTEMRRPVDIAPKKREKEGAAEYGVIRFVQGTRVMHDMFGPGEILSSRDMGGDVLYEVRFDNGQIKKLMATFAKLKKLQ